MKICLKHILKEKGLTQRELSSMVGITPTGLSAIARGRAMPSMATIDKIASALDVNPKRLFSFPPDEDGFHAVIISKGRHYYASSLEELDEIRKLLS